MGDAFEYLFIGTGLLTIGLLLRRIRQLEKGREEAPAPPPENAVPHVPAAPPPHGLAADAEMDMWALLVGPVSAILGQCELARGQRKMNARLEAIESHALRMHELLARLPGADRKIEEALERIAPESAVRGAVSSYSGLAVDRDVRVHLVLEPVPEVIANARLLHRALRHLVRTAITSAPPRKGDVTVAVGLLPVDDEPTHVAFAVADDGPGIEPARLLRILDPSIEEETEPTAEELAYSVVYALARAMGAQFAMDSAPGTGTRATIKVPLDRVALAKAKTLRRDDAAEA